MEKRYTPTPPPPRWTSRDCVSRFESRRRNAAIWRLTLMYAVDGAWAICCLNHTDTHNKNPHRARCPSGISVIQHVPACDLSIPWENESAVPVWCAWGKCCNILSTMVWLILLHDILQCVLHVVVLGFKVSVCRKVEYENDSAANF